MTERGRGATAKSLIATTEQLRYHQEESEVYRQEGVASDGPTQSG